MAGTMFVLLAGFGPGGSCAKACKETGESADNVARSGDDLARHAGDVPAPHVTPPAGRGVVPPVGGELAADVAHLSPSNLDATIAGLPEPDGGIAKLATTHSAEGTFIRVDGTGRTFGRDYGRTVDDLGLDAAQHEELIDVFGIAQDLAMEVIGDLIEGEDDPKAAATTEAARKRLRDAASGLDARLQDILDTKQYEAFVAAFGTAEMVAYRLGREKPIAKAKK